MAQPTIGRTVLYTLDQHDADAINRRRAGRATRDRIDVATLGSMVTAGDSYPAVITRAFPAGCNLQVHLDGVDAHWATTRPEGTEPGTWSWPPRV
ncbi:hypothetical protein ACWGB8_07885 [Kitasatospora sp. NPDC054939]